MFLNAPASQIVKIDFRLSEKCPLLFSLDGIMDDFGYFWLFLAMLAYFGLFWPPKPPQGGFCVFWGCPGVFPGGSQRIVERNPQNMVKIHKIWLKIHKNGLFWPILAYFGLFWPILAP